MGLDYVKQGEPMRASWANDVVSSIRRISKNRKKNIVMIGGGSSTGSSGCPFGTLTGPLSARAIKGGLVYAGDKNFTVPNYTISLANNTYIVYFEIPVTCNMDDDAEIILPGIETSTWTPAWQTSTVSSYPDNTNPSLPSGTGTIIIPLGTLVVASSAITFEEVACGNVTINQCAGTLTHARG